MSLTFKEARELASPFVDSLIDLGVGKYTQDYNQRRDNLAVILQTVHNLGFDQGCEKTAKAVEGTYLDKNL